MSEALRLRTLKAENARLKKLLADTTLDNAMLKDTLEKMVAPGTTKIHALCDAEGRLYALLLTGGHVHDIHGARALLAAVPTPRCLLGDKASDSNDIRAFLAEQTVEAVIPPKALRRDPPPFDPLVYRSRNIIERAFCRRKDLRGIATRYDKKAANFLAGACFAAAISIWLQ